MIKNTSKYLFYFVVFLAITSCDKQNKDSLLHKLADQTGDYDKPNKAYQIQFPKDHNSHKEFRHEWWYLTANLTSNTGKIFGIQWTLFRTAASKKHFYFAHAALADTSKHFAAYRNGREELKTVKFTKAPFSAQIDDWTWQSTGELLPASLTFGNNDEQHWQVALDLSASEHFYLQGEQGYSQKHGKLDIASHYYSQPFIKVKGRILFAGEWLNVSGDAWFDREWGARMLGADQHGWDWFSLRLTDDLALMIYRIRSDQQDHLYGSLMHKNGEIETLSKQQIHLSPSNNLSGKYPDTFNIRLDEYDINIEVKVVNKNQIMQFGIEYFEGMVTFVGSHQGKGFIEMTGYKK